MSQFYLEINLDNAAFSEGLEHELKRILTRAANNLDPNGASLRDINGNRVGKYYFNFDNE